MWKKMAESFSRKIKEKKKENWVTAIERLWRLHHLFCIVCASVCVWFFLLHLKSPQRRPAVVKVKMNDRLCNFCERIEQLCHEHKGAIITIIIFTCILGWRIYCSYGCMPAGSISETQLSFNYCVNNRYYGN